MSRCLLYILSVVIPTVSLLASVDVRPFHYQRSINGTHGSWHSVPLPSTVLTHLRPAMHDIRIIGLKSNGDTIEVPYVLDVSSLQNVRSVVPTTMFNSGWTREGFTCTVHVSDTQTVNHLQLDLVPLSHFSSDLHVEGSDDNRHWVSIARTYCRQDADQSGTDANTIHVDLSPCRFAYYRTSFHDFDSVRVSSAVLSYDSHSNGRVLRAQVQHSNTFEDSKLKRTIVDVTLKEALNISQAEFSISAPHDYERAVRILCLSDSVNVNGSWHKRYRTLWNGTLSSIRSRSVHFNPAFCSVLRIEIDNRDNAPLSIDSVTVYYAEVRLRARFDGAEKYVLIYGSAAARAPEYDIRSFVHTIPATLDDVTLGDEIVVSTSEAARHPLFENKLWLYVIMSFIIVALAGAMIRMMRSPKQQA